MNSRIARTARSGIGIGVLFFWLTAAPQIQPSPGGGPSAVPSNAPAPPGPYSISGIVVARTTGMLLDNAEVTLSAAGRQRMTLATVMTSETGVFHFDHLAAGKYTLDASHRGYIAAGYQEHEGFVTAVVTGPDQDNRNLRLDLEPEAVIDGTVTDDSGEPVGGAQVLLYRQVQQNGISRIVNTQSAVTDDTGTYEFPRVRAGDFYIAVMATPWFAFRPALQSDASGNLLPQDQQPHSPLDVAYPTTFYPNATDSASAASITANAGDRVQANFSLHAVAAVHARIRIPDSEGGNRSLSIPQLTTSAFGLEIFRPAGMLSVTGPPGNMVADISGLAPGHYSVREFGPPGEVNGGSIDLTTDQTIDFNPSGGAEISGKVAMASGQKLPDGVNAMLFPSGNQGRPIVTRISADGAFEFPSVAPGNYEFRASAFNRSLAVSQIAASGGQVQGSQITVGNDPLLLAATLAAGSVTVEGYAKKDDKGVGGVMILLVPRPAGASDQLYRRDQSDSDGSFALKQVVPGDYTVVALEDGWNLDWRQPKVLAPYLAHGVSVHIPEQAGTFNLAEPLAVQLR